MKGLFLVVTLLSMARFAKVDAAPCMYLTDSFSVASREAHAIFIGEVMKIEPFDSHGNGDQL